MVSAADKKETLIQRLERLVEENPDSADAYLRLGTALIKKGTVKRAEETLRRALELDPTCVKAWVNIGGIRLSKWDFDGCIEVNKKAIECDPNLVQAHYNQGLGHLYRGQGPEMVDCFERVIELEPQNAGGHYHLAVGLLAVGKVFEAKASVATATRLGFTPQPDFMKELEKKIQQKTGGKQEGQPATFEFGPNCKGSTTH